MRNNPSPPREPRLPQRQHPAHQTPIERFNEPVIVEVTVCTEGRLPLLANTVAHQLLREAWSSADFWKVGPYVLMPDHVHLFCTPARMPMTSLKQWIEYWKSRSATRWAQAVAASKNGGPASRLRQAYGGQAVPAASRLWQRDFWDTQMRNRKLYEEKLFYVRMNPVRQRLVPQPEDWPHQGEIHPLVWL
jgi:putative transposase